MRPFVETSQRRDRAQDPLAAGQHSCGGLLAHVTHARLTHVTALLILAPDIQEEILFLAQLPQVATSSPSGASKTFLPIPPSEAARRLARGR